MADALPLCVRIDFDDARGREALRKDGWREIEVLETWECRTPFPASSDVMVRLIKQDDVEACEKIAETAFEFDRLHIDPKVSDALANARKRGAIQDAMANCCQVYVAVTRRLFFTATDSSIDSVVSGFNIVKRDGPLVIIDLIAVAKEWRGKGVGQALLRAAVTPETELIRAGTQAVNQPARMLYRRCGFSLVRKQRTFHKDFVSEKRVVSLVA